MAPPNHKPVWAGHALLAPRLRFQLEWVVGSILDVGCGEEPVEFMGDVVRLDLEPQRTDDLFVQADAGCLPFCDRSFDTVVLGDILEHVPDPAAVVREAARVAAYRIVATIMEELRLPKWGYNTPDPAISGHCWKFKDEDIGWMIRQNAPHFWPREFRKQYECTHKGWPWYEWLICAERRGQC